MPCRDHGISLRDFLAGFFRGPWGTSYSSGKGFPEAPSVADAPDTCESLAGFFRDPLGDFLFIGERIPRDPFGRCRSGYLRISRRLFPWSLGETSYSSGKAAGLRYLFLSDFKTDLFPSYCSVPAWTIFEPGGTSWVSQMLPPMMLSWPIVTLPRIEVFEYTVTLSSRIG